MTASCALPELEAPAAGVGSVEDTLAILAKTGSTLLVELAGFAFLSEALDTGLRGAFVATTGLAGARTRGTLISGRAFGTLGLLRALGDVR